MLVDHFMPTPQAALQTLRAVRPSEYARTRNHIGGAVTRLSPYLTHGLLPMPDVMAALALRREHKPVFELGWREFFHHAWRHLISEQPQQHAASALATAARQEGWSAGFGGWFSC
jgi:deoxyribodipyrimidine photolyase